MLKGDEKAESENEPQTIRDRSSVNDSVVDNTLFVWDFDWTVINCNSDEYIPAQFMDEKTLNDGFRSLYKETNGDWHACVEGMVNRCIGCGDVGSSSNNNNTTSKESVMKAAQKMPYLIGIRNAIENHLQLRKTPYREVFANEQVGFE